MGTRGIVNPKMIKYALKRAGKTMGSDEISSSFPFIEKWGTSINPSITELERFSNAVYCPIGYFFLSEPPDEKIPDNAHICRKGDAGLLK